MMPAYSFQPRFVEPIRAGTKGGTIRAPRKNGNAGARAKMRHLAKGGHAYPDEQLQLYCRQRSPGGFLICYKACVESEQIVLDLHDEAVIFPDRPGAMLVTGEELEAFAKFDGFEDWPELVGFWRKTHQTDRFRGWHIRWLPLPVILGD